MDGLNMTEKLEKRLKEIEIAIANTENELKKLQANRVLLEGGKQEVLYWLNKKDELE
jgi:uncharacterized coiled-coil protein SlyX